MSDFDKEAEREKLREKYGDDETDRETTEQMSELLLKGATMTNAHCNNCGDPIFRYDGQEFCPTCQQPVDRGDADGAADADEDNIEVTTPSDDATVQFGGEPEGDSTADPEQRPSSDGPSQSTPETRSTPTAESADQPRSAPSVDPASTATETPSHTQRSSDAAPTTPSGNGTASDHLANAQVLLAQTVEEYARRARESDSPRQAQEYLEAAREAAETLDETGF